MGKALMPDKQNQQENLAIVILAAGKGTRMGGEQPKVLVESAAGSLLSLVLNTAGALNPDQMVIVKGFGGELVESAIAEWQSQHSLSGVTVSTALQEKQNGTGDAVRAALPALEDFNGDVIILCGDVPLLTIDTLQQLLAKHREEQATLSVLTTLMPEPGSYGRIIRKEEDGQLLAIREAKDCSPKELLLHEINSGVYVVDSAFLPGALQQLSNENSQGEYYLTDIVQRSVDEGQRAVGVLAASSQEIHGVNTYQDLQQINETLQQRTLECYAKSGVTITDPRSTWIHPTATIGTGTVIGPSTVIGENVSIGNGVTIEGMCHITRSTVGDSTSLRWGLRIEDATIGASCLVGPFAHLRPKTSLGDEVKVGNFVETKNAILANGAKASHLSYLGDCDVGKDANIGAGTITCNYDGYKKYRTVIEDGAFIGSNSSLIAPVTIGKGATVGAGSAINKDVAPGALGITRAEQRSIDGWSQQKRKKMKKD